jgi:23S rRNA pseudouridine955/2504/2580 synthase
MQQTIQHQVRYITIDSEYAGQRLDNYLIRMLKKVPREYIYRIIRKGEVRVNKKRQKADYRLQQNDMIRIPPLFSQNAPSSTGITKNLKDFLCTQILFENENFIVLNKPSGISVHGGSLHSFGIIEILRAARPELKFLELIHRLDKGTSGCLLIAKKKSALNFFQDLLRNQKIKKTYFALVEGHWPLHITEINAPLLKKDRDSEEQFVRIHPRGKTSITKIKIVTRYKNATLLAVSPLTGRTHQIRVHLMSKGHPIYGDEKYNPNAAKEKIRLFLHAQQLKFKSSTDEFVYEAPLPDDLKQFLVTLERK